MNKFLELNSNARDLVVAIGPCINHQHYEVGHDFFKKFLAQSNNNGQFFIISNNKILTIFKWTPFRIKKIFSVIEDQKKIMRKIMEDVFLS